MSKSKPPPFARKLRKLRRDPWLFATDAVKNRVDLLETLPPGVRAPLGLEVPCQHRYTVVSAVYNVEAYLDAFLRSLTTQTVGFERHIELILVDDGSTDGSPEIIHKWRRKYPRNIQYVRKDNGGQASARNLGLTLVTGDWVTFIDPDDFVNTRYFEHVEAFLTKHHKVPLGLLCCNWIFFHERDDRYVNNHPLSYRFKGGSRTVNPHSERNFIAPSAATSFYRTDLVARHGCRFDERIRPSFEDAHFTARFLIECADAKAGYIAESEYYYRKRSNESSTLDGAWTHPGRYREVLEHGHLDLIERSRDRCGHVPPFIQWLLLYDLFWSIKRIVANTASVSFLSDAQKSKYRELIERIFDHIDTDTIEKFNLAGCWFFHKAGMLALFKQTSPDTHHAYVRDYDRAKGLVQISYFFRGAPLLERFLVNGRDATPHFAKSRIHRFLEEVFVEERLCWVPVDETCAALEFELDGAPARLKILGSPTSGPLTHGAIARAFKGKTRESSPSATALRTLATSPAVAARYRNAWMLLDRDQHADDNAEHLYRYILRNHPEINAFFVLAKESHDWDRLQAEGFRLVPFGGIEHKLLVLNADHVISSHADAFVLHILPASQYGDLLTFKFTFLQHGVIRDDISSWLNNKKIDLFVTSSPAEHESVAGDRSNYKFGRHCTKLVGLSRHDGLLEREEKTEKCILIMPTWRNYLVDNAKHGTTHRGKSERFYKSNYARTWKALLHSPRLQEVAQQHGYSVVFFPHANVQIYNDWFEAPDWIEVHSHKSEPILQRLYRRAAMLITDYSSVFFEMGILEKPVVYYQFDRDEMYGGGHPSRVGYFDFDRDGFGPAVTTEPELLSTIDGVLQQECQTPPEYLRRMRTTLPLRDGENRRRTFEAITALDAPTVLDSESEGIGLAMAETASRVAQRTDSKHTWGLAKARWSSLAATSALSPAATALRLAQAHRGLGELPAARTLLRDLPADDARVRGESVLLDILEGVSDGRDRVSTLSGMSFPDGDEERVTVVLEAARAQRRRGHLEAASETLDMLDASPGREQELAYLALDRGRWGDAVARLSLSLRRVPVCRRAEMHLGLARALVGLSSPNKALPHAKRASALDPGGAEPALTLAELLVAADRFGDAHETAVALYHTRRPSWRVGQARRLAGVLCSLQRFDTMAGLLESRAARWLREEDRFALLEGLERWKGLLAMDGAWREALDAADAEAVEHALSRARTELSAPASTLER
ncbi:MAG: CDP-glycerol glycerophosphotransferase family protein [Sandaracinaceae bacterium]